MPSRVVTKRRVKRRQQRLVSKNAKRNARSVRKHRKTAKKVMRGGNLRTTSEYDTPVYVSTARSPGSGNLAKTLKNSVYVLYDSIPTHHNAGTTYSADYQTINVPICVIFFEHHLPKDNIYLFFHKDVTEDEITRAVKLLLGINPADEFALDPPITPTKDVPVWADTTTQVYQNVDNQTDSDLQNNQFKNLLGNTVVKLTQCSMLSEYCIEAGTFNGNTVLGDDAAAADKLKTTPRKIRPPTKPSGNWNGNSVKALLCKTNENTGCDFVFAKKVIESQALQPNLYIKYRYHYSKRPNYYPTERPLKMDLNLDVHYVKQLTVKDIIDSIIVGSHIKKYTVSMMNNKGVDIEGWADAEQKVKEDQMSEEQFTKWKEEMASNAAEEKKREEERIQKINAK